MSASWLSPPFNVEIAYAVAPLLSLLGLIGGVMYFAGASRSDPSSSYLFYLAAISNLLVAYLVNKIPSRTDQPNQASRAPRAPYGLLASFCTAASWGCHLLAHWGWGSCNPCLGKVALRAFEGAGRGLNVGHLGEILTSSFHQIFAWLVLPAPVVILALVVHVCIIYRTVQQANIQPSLPWTAIWFTAQTAIPYLHLRYMRRLLAHRQALSQLQAKQKSDLCVKPFETEGWRPSSGKQSYPVARPVKDQLAPAASGSNSLSNGHHIPAHNDGGGEQEGPKQQHGGGKGQAQQQQVSSQPVMHHPKGVAAPSNSRVQGLLAAQRLMQRGQAGSYTSRLAQPQLIIKFLDTHPEHLATDVIGHSNGVLMAVGHMDLLVSRACARRGCCLLVVDLVCLASGLPSQGDSRGSLSSTTLQAWLGALLAPETRVPEDAAAHISFGTSQLEARWQATERCWAVKEAPNTLPPARILSLLFVDQPIARLAPAAVLSGSGHAAGRHHRMSLLLKVQHPASSLSFVGSDASAAAPARGTDDGRASAVQCVARGFWGTCCPVKVAGLEWSADEESSSAHAVHNADGYTLANAEPGMLIALTLDVDLATAPHAGGVQLELWQGHTLLVSAPLLLLPKTSGSSDSDPVLEELQRTAAQQSWEAGGAAAFLIDLGQLLSAGEVINGAGSNSTGPNQVQGPQAWGGIPDSTARQLSSSAPLLSSLLVMSEGLLEYAAAEGLAATSHLVQALSDTVKQRLEQLQAPGGSTATAQAATPPVGHAHEITSPANNTDPASNTGPVVSDGFGHASSSAYLYPPLPAPVKPSAAQKDFDAPAAPESPGPSGQPDAQQSGRLTPQLVRQPSYREAAAAVVTGFHPREVEGQYGVWLAANTRALVRTWSTMFLCWVLTCTLRSYQEGLPVLVSHLPFNLLLGAPYLGSAFVALKGYYRWSEPSLVMHGVMRAVACWSAWCGLIAWPSSYSLLIRMGVDAWGCLLLHTPCEPLRFPCLLLSSALYAVGVTAIALVCQIKPWGLRVALPAVGGLFIGMALDMHRRRAFLRQQQQQQQQPSATAATQLKSGMQKKVQ